MKKLLLSFTVACLTSAGVNAQCTPDPQFTTPGIYPDSATGLAPACVDMPYSELITIIVPADTIVDLPIVGPTPIPIDQATITSWTGLPTGFTYACYDAGNTNFPVDQCDFEGGTTGCVLISGNPTLAQIGSYQQVITVEASAGNGLQTTSTDVDYYYIQIIECSAGLGALTTSKFFVYPNPSKNVITLNGLNDISVESVVVVDINGAVMASYKDINTPALDMNINHLANGMYFVQINYNGVQEIVKFIKE